MSMPKTPKTPMPSKMYGQMPDEGIYPIGMNPVPFENLIKSKGIRMIRQKPIPCPNQRTLNGNDHDPNCTLCYNGFVYYDQQEFIGAFSGNSLNKQFGMNGTFDLDQASIVVPSKDKDGNEMDFQYFDQILIPDFTVRVYQRVQANQTGVDRLHFPATHVDFVMGSDGTIYQPGKDCVVNQNGMIKWISPNRPKYNLDIDAGEVYSINYYTKPTLTIVGMPHQLRVTQSLEADGTTVQNRFPQLVVVRKDFVPYQSGDLSGRKDMPEPEDGQV